MFIVNDKSLIFWGFKTTIKLNSFCNHYKKGAFMGNSKDDLIAERITKPYNEAWRVIKLILNDNSDEAWNKYVEAIAEFHKLLSGARTPKEFGYLKALYTAVDYAGEVIGQINDKNTKAEKEGRKK